LFAICWTVLSSNSKRSLLTKIAHILLFLCLAQDLLLIKNCWIQFLRDLPYTSNCNRRKNYRKSVDPLFWFRPFFARIWQHITAITTLWKYTFLQIYNFRFAIIIVWSRSNFFQLTDKGKANNFANKRVIILWFVASMKTAKNISNFLRNKTLQPQIAGVRLSAYSVDLCHRAQRRYYCYDVWSWMNICSLDRSLCRRVAWLLTATRHD